MNRSQPSPGTRTVTGGTFIGSAVGQGNTISHNKIVIGEVQTSESLDGLRTAIASARDELVRAAGSLDSQAEVGYEIRKIEQELSEEEPQGAVVLSRWEQVTKLLSPLAAASDAIAKITVLITNVFGRS
jgi:hypothetical protein